MTQKKRKVVKQASIFVKIHLMYLNIIHHVLKKVLIDFVKLKEVEISINRKKIRFLAPI